MVRCGGFTNEDGQAILISPYWKRFHCESSKAMKAWTAQIAHRRAI
jgi:hypothetical protein